MSLILCFVLFLAFDVSLSRNIPTPLVPSKNNTCDYGICTEAKDYPGKEISIAMQLLHDLGYNVDPFFGVILNVDVSKKVLDIGSRRRLCERSTDGISSKMSFPLVMKNTKGDWKYIVNVDKFKQTIRVETCKNGDSNPVFQQDQIKCGQTFQKLYLLTFDNFKLSYDEFIVPKICEPYVMET